MKIKKKEYVSENSESDCDDPSPVDDIPGFKIDADGYLESQITTEKLTLNYPNESNESEEEVITNQPVNQDSRNEANNNGLTEETTNTNLEMRNYSQVIHSDVKSTFYMEELSSDDEIYLMQCPESCKKKDLCKNINLTKSNCSITSNNEVYKVELINTENKFITLAVPKETTNGSLVKLPLKGHIIIYKDVNKIPCNLDETDSAARKVVFPKDIKVRHPLLGAEWEEYIDSANKAIKNSARIRKKNKKIKKEKNLENQEAECVNIKRESSPTEIPVHKKKKKKKDSC